MVAVMSLNRRFISSAELVLLHWSVVDAYIIQLTSDDVHISSR